ncbi:MAG: hypothetical protein ACRDVZ_07310, partial [Jiangellaceae bacterium]
MVDRVRDGVLLRVAPIAHAAEQQATQRVRVASAVTLAGLASCALGGEELLGLFERLGFDEQFVNDLGGPDSGVRRVPAHPGLVAERDVVDVD